MASAVPPGDAPSFDKSKRAKFAKVIFLSLHVY